METGASYGSRLAFTTARDYPSSIHAIVHDGPDLPEDQEVVDDLRGTEVMLHKLFSKCAADAACAVKFPQLRSRFLAAIPRLRQQPLSTGDERFNDNRVVGFIHDWLFSHLRVLKRAHCGRRVERTPLKTPTSIMTVPSSRLRELDASLSGLAGYTIAMLYTNATNVVFGNAGHIQVHMDDACASRDYNYYRPCASGLARQFLADPQQSLDTRCAETQKLRLVH